LIRLQNLPANILFNAKITVWKLKYVCEHLENVPVRPEFDGEKMHLLPKQTLLYIMLF